MNRNTFLVALVLAFANSAWAQGSMDKNSELLAPPTDSLNKAMLPGMNEQAGTLIVSAKKAMLPGPCATRKRVAGLVKLYEICAFSKLASLKSWELAFQDSVGGNANFMLSLQFSYNLGGTRLADYFDEGLKQVGTTYESDKGLLLDFLKVQAGGKGDRIDLFFGASKDQPLWLHIQFQGKEGVQEYYSENAMFAKDLASIWLGAKAVDAGVRQALLK